MNILKVILSTSCLLLISSISLAQQNTLSSLNIKLKRIEINDTSIMVLRTTEAQQKALAGNQAFILRANEMILDGNIERIREGTRFINSLNYLELLENVDPQIAIAYHNEYDVYKQFMATLQREEEQRRIQADAAARQRKNMIARGIILDTRSAMYLAEKKMRSSPVDALLMLNDIVAKSNYATTGCDYIYEMSFVHYEEVAYLRMDCMILMHGKRFCIPVYYDLIEKANDLNGNKLRKEVFLSELIILKVELNDTLNLMDDYKALKGFTLDRSDSGSTSRIDAHSVVLFENVRKDKKLTGKEKHLLALKVSDPYCKDKLEQEQWDEVRNVNPHFGKQVPVGSLFGLFNADIEKILGKPVSQTLEINGEAQYRAYVYKTSRAKYHISYRNSRAIYIVVYPLIFQAFSMDQLSKFGWQFDLYSECVKQPFCFQPPLLKDGYVGNLYFIYMNMDIGYGNGYSIYFYSTDKKRVQKIEVF